MIRFYCPKCRAQLEARDDQAGAKVQCGNCGQRLEVPQPPPNKTVLGSLEAPPAPVVEPAPETPVSYYLCPHCGRKNGIRPRSLGTLRKCSECRNRVDVPEAESQEELDEAMRRERLRLEEERERWRQREAARRAAEREEAEREADAERDAEARARASANTTIYITLIVCGAVVFGCCIVPMACGLIGNLVDPPERERQETRQAP